MLIKILLEKKVESSKICDIIKLYPQVLVNAKVSNDKKYDFDKNEEVKKAMETIEEEFAGNGRVLIRPSGTEPLVRIMIEGENIEYISKKANEMKQLIEENLK